MVERPPAQAATVDGDRSLTIPPLIKRNTLLLAVSQTFSGAGHGMVYTLSSLMVVELLGSAALAGVGLAILGVSRFVVAYPLGKLADAWGRKPGLYLGWGLSVLGAITMGCSMIWSNFPLYVIGMLCLGLGTGAAHQLRIAAADMYPPSRRAEGLGWVLTGSLLGIFGTPLLVGIADAISPPLGLHPIGVAWLLVPIIAFPAVFLIWLVQPDPKEIAIHLERYYPGYRPAVRAASEAAEPVSVARFLAHYPKRTAVVANFAAQANMAIVMVIASLILAHHGHHLPAISASLALHSIGMFGFSLPLGWASDRFGRRNVLLAGIVVEAAGTLLVTLTADYWTITVGATLVGLGWSGVNVAGTALLADTSRPWERGRAIGLSDAAGGVAGVALPLVTGPMAVAWGLPSTGVLGVVLVLPSLAMLLALRELRPGLYADRRLQ